ncbi:MAG TPA: S1 RNA-binding domain-containing protein, partial [Treponemataceae bacterium]|nr:S1 RNA-binding domain-containing protein [Treponemataceae bacterium]
NYNAAREILPLVKSSSDVTSQLKKDLKERFALGETTITDIIEELKKPNRDPREGYPKPIMQKGVVTFEDLKEGMKVTGKIKNVVDFGAFVDLGIKETALLHISELSDSFVEDPMEVIKVGDIKECTIIGLDIDRRRISLSLKSDAASRIGGAGSVKPASSADGQAVKRVVRVAKAGSPGSSGTATAVKERDDRRPYQGGNRNDNRSYNSGNDRGGDDGMTYNPFAALLNKKK